MNNLQDAKPVDFLREGRAGSGSACRTSQDPHAMHRQPGARSRKRPPCQRIRSIKVLITLLKSRSFVRSVSIFLME